MINKTFIKTLIETYSCDINKNTECSKRNCICNNGPCKRVVEFKYAKKTPLNYIKRIINKIRGVYRLNKSESIYKLKIEIDKDEALKDIRKVKKEVFYMLDDEHVKEVFEVGIEHIEHKR